MGPTMSLESPHQNDSGPTLTRRELLGRCGMGFGLIGLAGILADDNLLGSAASACTGSAQVPWAAGAQGSAFCRQGQAGRPSVHERWALARRHVRSQADAGEVPRQDAPGAEPPHRAQDRRGPGLSLQIQEVRPERHRGQRALRPDRRAAHRRHVHHPLDVRRRAQP